MPRSLRVFPCHTSQDKPIKKFQVWVLTLFSWVVLFLLIWGLSNSVSLSGPATKAPLPEFETTISEKDGMTMVLIPAGEFIMGSNADNILAECQKYNSDCSRDWFVNEIPLHNVYLNAFWIDQTEITNTMFARCVDSEKCNLPHNITYYSSSDYADHPVVYVDWNQANAYCQWTRGRLPTEAEWEKAASWDERNQTKYAYPWGDEYDCKKGNFNSGCQSFFGTSPVGSFPNGVSPYLLYDMAGNVWEWVNDYYQGNYYSIPDYGVNNPQGPTSGQARVLRGGSWFGSVGHIRSTYRYGDHPENTSGNVGFRCTRSQP